MDNGLIMLIKKILIGIVCLLVCVYANAHNERKDSVVVHQGLGINATILSIFPNVTIVPLSMVYYHKNNYISTGYPFIFWKMYAKPRYGFYANYMRVLKTFHWKAPTSIFAE